MRMGVWLSGIVLLGAPAISVAPVGGEPRLLYRSTDRMTSALAYDVETETAVELVQLGSYGPSVLWRVSSGGKAGEVIWKTEGEALCPEGYCGGVGLDYSEKLSGYLVRVAVGTSHRVPSVYLAQSGGKARLVARTVIQSRPAYPDEDKLEPGVVGISGSIESALIADGAREVLISTEASGAKWPARTYLIDAVKGQLIGQLEGKIVGKSGQSFFVSGATKGWKRLETAETMESELAALAQRPLIPVDDPQVTKVVEAGNRRAEWRAISGEVLVRRMNDGGAQATTGALGSVLRWCSIYGDGSPAAAGSAWIWMSCFGCWGGASRGGEAVSGVHGW